MTGEVEHLPHQRQQLLQTAAVGIEAGFAKALLADVVAVPPDQGGAELAHLLQAEAQGLAGIAEGAFGAIADNGGSDGAAFTPVAFIDVLYDFFAPLMFKVDID